MYFYYKNLLSFLSYNFSAITIDNDYSFDILVKIGVTIGHSVSSCLIRATHCLDLTNNEFLFYLFNN